MNWKPVTFSLLSIANITVMSMLAIFAVGMRGERDDAILQRDMARKQNAEARAYIGQMEQSMITLPAHSSGSVIIDKDGTPHIELDKPGDRWNIGPNGLPQLESFPRKHKEDRVQ